jgi:hypothetical protein
MFKFVDNDACTLYLDFVHDLPTVLGEVRNFNKATYKDTKKKWLELLEGLQQEGFSKLYSQLTAQQHNMLAFEKRVGFVELWRDGDKVILSKDL